MTQTYYAELHTKDGTKLTQKYSTSASLLEALAKHTDALKGVDVRFFNIVQDDNGMRLYHGL